MVKAIAELRRHLVPHLPSKMAQGTGLEMSPLYALRSALYALRSTLYALRSTLYALLSTLIELRTYKLQPESHYLRLTLCSKNVPHCRNGDYFNSRVIFKVIADF